MTFYIKYNRLKIMKTTKKFVTRKALESWMSGSKDAILGDCVNLVLGDYINLVLELANGGYSIEELKEDVYDHTHNNEGKK